jgi:outer membrane scaffolding protein for murein synthesis (MipA/OmpV family)
MKHVMKGFILFVALALAPAAAVAQQGPLDMDSVPTVAGIIIGSAPDYLGSSYNKAVAAPFLKYTLPGSYRYLTLRGTELSFNMINHPVFRLGPMINYRGERAHVENDQVDRMTKIDAALEGGGYAGLEFADKDNPRKRILLTLSWLHDMTGAHNGWLMTGTARAQYPIAAKWDASLGISGTYGDNAYTSTYFGVNATDAVLSGLPRYTASAGFRDFSITPAIIYHLNQTWHFVGGVRYMRLLEDAADSPLVADVGSKDQLFGGVGVLYSWK